MVLLSQTYYTNSTTSSSMAASLLLEVNRNKFKTTEQHDHNQYYCYYPRADYCDDYRSSTCINGGEGGELVQSKMHNCMEKSILSTKEENERIKTKAVDYEPSHDLYYHYSPLSVVTTESSCTYNLKANDDPCSSGTLIPRFVSRNIVQAPPQTKVSFSTNDEEKKDDDDVLVSYPTKCISGSSTTTADASYKFGKTSLFDSSSSWTGGCQRKKKSTSTSRSSSSKVHLPEKKRGFYATTSTTMTAQSANKNDVASTTMKMMTSFEQSAIDILLSIRAYEESKLGQKRSLYTTTDFKTNRRLSKGAQKPYESSDYSSSPKKKQRLVWEQDEMTKNIKSSSSVQARSINSTTKKNKRRPRGGGKSRQAVPIVKDNYEIETNVLMSLLEEKQDELSKEEEERQVLLLCQKITEIEQQQNAKCNECCYNPLCEDVVHCICGSTLLTDRAHRRAMRQHQHLLLHTSGNTTS